MFAHLHPHLEGDFGSQHRSWSYHLALAVAVMTAGLVIALVSSQLLLDDVSLSTSVSAPASELTLPPTTPVDGPPPVNAATASAAADTVTADVLTATIVAPEGMSITLVTLFDATGAQLGARAPVDGGVRFDGLASGIYQVVYQAETGVSAVNGG